MRHRKPDRSEIAHDVVRLGASAACRLHGIHRSTWYRWESDRTSSPDPRRPPLLEEEILRISHERPSWGCDRIAYFLALGGTSVSSPTVQKVLVRHGLGRRHERERRAGQASGGIPLPGTPADPWPEGLSPLA